MILSLLTVLSLITPGYSVDGTVLDDLAEVRVYRVGLTQPVATRLTTEIETFLSFDLPGLYLGKRCWYATAVDTSGNESPNSVVVCKKSRWNCYKCHE